MFSLASLGQAGNDIEASQVIAALGSISNEAELESALGELASYAEMVPDDDIVGAIGAVQAIRASLLNPFVRATTPQTQSRAFAQLERNRAIIASATKLQSEDAQRPNVFIFARFDHPGAGPQTIADLKPSLPAQGTLGTNYGPLHFIQARTFLRRGTWADAEIDIAVARVGNAQYASPATVAQPEGLPIEYYASHSYNSGLKPPRIRGLEQADSNTVVTFRSVANAPCAYGIVLEFTMDVTGGPCSRILPSLVRGPMNITASRFVGMGARGRG